MGRRADSTRNRRRGSTALLGLLLGGSAALPAAEVSPSPTAFKVVVNVGNRTDALSRQELSAIFLGRKTEWPDGTRAVPVDQPESAPAREAFSRAVHGRAASAVRRYWMQILFSGRGVPPVEKSGDDAVLADVRARREVVGYVSSGARVDGVKVLRVDP
jgi:ABC-type phosphate transport system substrate-binding protein